MALRMIQRQKDILQTDIGTRAVLQTRRMTSTVHSKQGHTWPCGHPSCWPQPEQDHIKTRSCDFLGHCDLDLDL